MIKKLAAGSVIALAGAVLVATPANAASDYAAIAYSPDDGVYGWVNHAASANAAKSGATTACQDKGGTSCDWVVWSQNECLVLLVDSDGNFAGGHGATVKAAIAQAQQWAKDNGFTVDSTKPVTSLCTSDEGPDQG